MKNEQFAPDSIFEVQQDTQPSRTTVYWTGFAVAFVVLSLKHGRLTDGLIGGAIAQIFPMLGAMVTRLAFPRSTAWVKVYAVLMTGFILILLSSP